MINPWKVLGVHRASTPDEIKKNYYDAMKQAHPDAGGIGNSSDISEAYKILTTPKLLRQTIQAMAVWSYVCAPCKGKGFTFKQKGLTDRTTTRCTACGGSGFILKEGNQ